MICPIPNATRGERSRIEGAMVTAYSSDVHMAIAYMRRVDGTLKPTKSGQKPLNFFPDEGQIMFVST